MKYMYGIRARESAAFPLLRINRFGAYPYI